MVRGSSLLILHTPWHSTINSGVWFQKKKIKNYLHSTTPSTQSAKLDRLLEHKYWGEETCSVGEGQERAELVVLGCGSTPPKIGLILETGRERTSSSKVT